MTCFGRPWHNGVDLVGCTLSLAAVTQSRFPDIGVGEAQYSRHAAETDILLEFHEAVPQALTLLGVARFIAWRLMRPFLGECRQGPRYFGECQVCQIYARTHQKDLVPHSSSWWNVRQIVIFSPMTFQRGRNIGKDIYPIIPPAMG